tara:strand:- start:69 stop:1352 length:1284 start_codon:yes stop_codon:yes gene_type:complete
MLKDKKLLIAISGGIDSMVLLDLCSKNIPLNKLHGIHINHNLSSQANEYEKFVKERCFEKKISLIVYTEERKTFKGESMEMWGRRVRYRNFFKSLNDLNFDYLLTAHHGNDSFETILMNIERGCSIRGLRGIIPKNGQIIRPLINFKKSDIITYAKKNSIDFIYDLTNDDISIKRNYTRKCIVPNLIAKDGLILDKFSDISRKSQNAIYKEKVIMRFIASKMKDNCDFYNLNDEDLLNFNMYFKIRLIKEIVGESDLPWNRHKYKLLNNFILKSKTGFKIEINKSWELLRDRTKWILNKKNRVEKIKINIDGFGFYNVGHRIISFKETDEHVFRNNANTELIDFDKIKNKDIQIRNWVKGDKFQPLGMKGSKKVSDYLIDKKIDIFKKEKQLVVTADNEIIWLCGQRLSNNVKIKDNTCNFMELSIF